MIEAILILIIVNGVVIAGYVLALWLVKSGDNEDD